MPNETDSGQKLKLAATADLMGKGAALLSEACPRCGGVQIKFRGRVYCTNEDDLSKALASTAPKDEMPPTVRPVVGETSAPSVIGNSSSERSDLRLMLEGKLEKVSKQLESTQDLDQQEKLLALVEKYLDALSKLKK